MQPRGERQENINSPCDTRTSIRTIAKQFPDFRFNTVFSEVPGESGRWALTYEAIFQPTIVDGLRCVSRKS